MDDPPQGGRDGNGSRRGRPRWARRTPYGMRREGFQSDDVRAHISGQPAATYAALDLESRTIEVHAFSKKERIQALVQALVEENTRKARERGSG